MVIPQPSCATTTLAEHADEWESLLSGLCSLTFAHIQLQHQTLHTEPCECHPYTCREQQDDSQSPIQSDEYQIESRAGSHHASPRRHMRSAGRRRQTRPPRDDTHRHNSISQDPQAPFQPAISNGAYPHHPMHSPWPFASLLGAPSHASTYLQGPPFAGSLMPYMNGPIAEPRPPGIPGHLPGTGSATSWPLLSLAPEWAGAGGTTFVINPFAACRLPLDVVRAFQLLLPGYPWHDIVTRHLPTG
jgi:hypothetical protein